MKCKLLVSLYVSLGVICDFASASSSSDSESQASYFDSITNESNRVKNIARSYSMSSLGKRSKDIKSNQLQEQKDAEMRRAMTSTDNLGSDVTLNKTPQVREHHEQEQIDTSNITVTPVVRTRKNSDVKRKQAKAQDSTSKDIQKIKKTIENPKLADKKNSEPNQKSQKVMSAKQDDTNRATNAAASHTENNIDRRQTVNKRSSSVQRPRLKNAIDNPSLNNDNKSAKKGALTSDEEISKRKKEESLLALLDDEEILESCVNVATLGSRIKKLFQAGLGVKSFFENDFSSVPMFGSPLLHLGEALRIYGWRNLLKNPELENSQSYLDTYGAVMDLIPIGYSRFDLPHLDFSGLDIDDVLSAITPILNSYKNFLRTIFLIYWD